MNGLVSRNNFNYLISFIEESGSFFIPYLWGKLLLGYMTIYTLSFATPFA